jgi:putative ABC transport system ATP-binding protein
VIQVKKLSKTFGRGNTEVKALDSVSFDIAEGEMLCIMGKSGSGKSTLLRQLGLLDFPTSGSLLLHTTDLTKLSDDERSHFRLEYLGYVFQDFALIQELTALENVFMPGFMRGGKRNNYHQKSKELLELVGLQERIYHLPKELSGGEQQRVAIARALINTPKVIFADEPCANLDSVSSRTIMEILTRLNKEFGSTIIFVSHDPDDIKYSSRTIYLKDGKVVEPYF